MASKIGAITFKIKAGGKNYDNPGILSMSITHQANAISLAEIMIIDGDVAKREFKLSQDPNFAPGKELKIELGHGPDDVVPVFEGIIVRHQIRARKHGGTSLILEIKHNAVKMTHIRNAKHFLEMTDGDIIEKLVKANGLKVKVEGNYSTEHERMVQYNLTDWDFMVLRAEANGKLVYTKADGDMVIADPKVDAQAGIKATFGDNIYEFETESEARDQYAEASGIAWDHSGQELLEQEGEASMAVADTTKPKAKDMATSLSDGAFRLRHPGDLPDSELKAWSNAKLQRSRLSKVRGRIQLKGDAKLEPGGTLVLAGLSDSFNGPAFISAVRHHIEDGLWLSDVEIGLSETPFLSEHPDSLEAPASGLVAPMRGLQVGVVKEIEDDPAGFFRVLVKMPLVDDTEEGIWCRVSHPDAGASHTLFFQPAVGDEVVLGFLNEDPRHAIVLGSLHNKDANKPPIEDNDRYLKKGIVTTEGLMLIFNDEDKSVTIETPAGKKVTLDENEGTILLEDEYNNKIELSKDGITIESGKDLVIKAVGDVSVEGMNIEQSAQVQFKAEGTAGIEVSSSATAVLKGALVQIN